MTMLIVPPCAQRGEVPAERAEGSCITSLLTPPPPYDGGTSPRKTRGGKR